MVLPARGKCLFAHYPPVPLSGMLSHFTRLFYVLLIIIVICFWNVNRFFPKTITRGNTDKCPHHPFFFRQFRRAVFRNRRPVSVFGRTLFLHTGLLYHKTPVVHLFRRKFLFCSKKSGRSPRFCAILNPSPVDKKEKCHMQLYSWNEIGRAHV